jgi:hypothetical protein
MTRQHDHSFRPRVEGLEERDTPNATVGLDGGILTILGTDGPDRVTISRSAGQVFVTQFRSPSDQTGFDATQVQRIVFRGFSGNDRFINRTHLNATALGDGGNDTLVSGTGTDRLFGGPGKNVLIGYPQTMIEGGGGFNVIRRRVILTPVKVPGAVSNANSLLSSGAANLISSGLALNSGGSGAGVGPTSAPEITTAPPSGTTPTTTPLPTGGTTSPTGPDFGGGTTSPASSGISPLDAAGFG